MLNLEADKMSLNREEASPMINRRLARTSHGIGLMSRWPYVKRRLPVIQKRTERQDDRLRGLLMRR
jgi:hypothetical protein